MGDRPPNYYHYTTGSNAEAIKQSGVIRQSGAMGDAAYGNGTYLTGMQPNSGDKRIASNNYDGLAPQQLVQRTEAYFKIPSNHPSVRDAVRVDQSRDIHLVPGRNIQLTKDVSNYKMRKNFGK